MKFRSRKELEKENEGLFKRVCMLHEEVEDAHAKIEELQKKVYALQMDNDIYEAALHTLATRKSAEVVNRILDYQAEREKPWTDLTKLYRL